MGHTAVMPHPLPRANRKENHMIHWAVGFAFAVGLPMLNLSLCYVFRRR